MFYPFRDKTRISNKCIIIKYKLDNFKICRNRDHKMRRQSLKSIQLRMFNIYQCHYKLYIMEHIQCINYFDHNKSLDNSSSIMWMNCMSDKDKYNLSKFQNQGKSLMDNRSSSLCRCRLSMNQCIEYKDHQHQYNIPKNIIDICYHYMRYNFQYIFNNLQIHLPDSLIHIICIMLKSYIISNC